MTHEYYGIRVVEDPRMMPGAYFFKDRRGNVLAMGHIGMGLLTMKNTEQATQVVCSTAAFKAIAEKVHAA